jgi:hypothetical protein
LEYFKVLYGQRGEELGVQSEEEYQRNLHTGHWHTHPDYAKIKIKAKTVLDNEFVDKNKKETLDVSKLKASLKASLKTPKNIL